MIDLSTKTYKKILEDMLADIPGDLNKRDGSLIRTSLGAAGWAIEGLYLELAYIQRQAYAKTATGEYLDYIVAQCDLTRKQATPAVRYARFNVSAPLGTRFSVKNISENIGYYLSTECSYSPSDDYPDAPYLGQVTCETAGSIGNEYSGDLSTISYISGLTVAILLGIVEYGDDEESDESLRKRYELAVGAVEFGGNIASYRNYILAMSGVGAVQIYPAYDGPGTVLCSVIDTDYNPLSEDKIQEIQYAVCPPESTDPDNPSANGYGMAPIGAKVEITTATGRDIHITADIKIKAGSPKSIEEITADAIVQINAYFKVMLDDWGTMGTWNHASYSLILYYNRVVTILNDLDDVEVATNVMVNNGTDDITLIENKYFQQIPKLQSITLTRI